MTIPKLTPRQTEIIRLVAIGCTDKEIAARLGISCRTVSVHVAKVMRNLSAKSRPHAVAILIRQTTQQH